MTIYRLALLFFIAVILVWNEKHNVCDGKRLYTHQFPPEADHLELPSIVSFSHYMGKLQYPHLPLLLESMRWNPKVDFHIINIIETGSDDAHDIKNLTTSMKIPNVFLHILDMKEWGKRVKEKLGLNIPWDQSWFYKLCDYKPVIAYIFPEFAGLEYKYWGFVDLDVIWGNFTKFASWFQGQPFVISGWWGSTGAASFFINEQWTKEFMFQDPKYLPLLANRVYHNLDEEGGQVDPQNVVDNGDHAIFRKIIAWADAHDKPLNRGLDWKDHCFYDEGDSNDWAGPIRWFRGSLQVVHGSPEFPPARELLFYHRPGKEIDFPKQIRYEMFQDMMKYGYLLPYWIPLLSRFACLTGDHYRMNSTIKSLPEYRPYAGKCLIREEGNTFSYSLGLLTNAN